MTNNPDDTTDESTDNKTTEPSKVKDSAINKSVLSKKMATRIAGGLLALVVVAGGAYGYIYTSTPAHIRNPKFDHYHLRTQVVVDGASVDFASNKFQDEYDANSCSSALPELPIDFHDGEDQITHVHWSGITGGELLKYFGWNMIGGSDNSLGKRFDRGILPASSVSIKGSVLPAVPEGSNYYVYTGDGDDYEARIWDDFLSADLEEFFGTKSKFNTDGDTTLNILDMFLPRASAHGAVVDEHAQPVEGELDKDRLERINNLIGNVVIFVQSQEPGDDEIAERFNNLAPLHDSTCGG